MPGAFKLDHLQALSPFCSTRRFFKFSSSYWYANFYYPQGQIIRKGNSPNLRNLDDTTQRDGDLILPPHLRGPSPGENPASPRSRGAKATTATTEWTPPSTTANRCSSWPIPATIAQSPFWRCTIFRFFHKSPLQSRFLMLQFSQTKDHFKQQIRRDVSKSCAIFVKRGCSVDRQGYLGID